ncbi:MAG TPA: hypothetical protein VFY99_11565 [Solirubrobacterales bacterium]
MQAWLAAAIARRPALFLVANLVLAVALGALALGAPDRVVVGGGLERGGEEESQIVVVLTPEGTLTPAVARQAVSTVESGLLADGAVAAVEPLETGRGEDPVLLVTAGAGTAAEAQSAAERVTGRIDPGPFEVAVGGEAGVQALAREQVKDELPGLALLAAPLALLALGFAFGLRQLAAPVLAAATAALGGIAVLRLVPASLDLAATGISVAAIVGIAVAIEACLAVRRAHADAAFAGPEAMLAEALRGALPRVAWAGGGGAVAAALLFAIPLPAAHSAAVGGIAAALLAAACAPVAMASALALAPAKPPAEPARDTGSSGAGERARGGALGRVGDEIAYRPALAWIPAVLAAAALGLATAPAFDADAVALAAADLGSGSEPARVAGLLARELPAGEAERLASGTERSATGAAELFRTRLPWILGAITLAGLLAAYAPSRSVREAIANGIGAALPAGAVCGLLALAADGSLPFELGPIGEATHAGVLLAALATLGAVGVARAAFAAARSAITGTLVAGAAAGALAGAQLDAVAQLGVAVAAGLVIDLALVRAVLAPCLERALPARLA